MSIINEALKKTGQSVAHEPRPELLRKRSRVNWGPFFVMGILALVTAPILAPWFSRPYKTTQAALQVPSGTTVGAGQMRGQFAIEETSLAMAPVPNFALSGLVYSKADSYCLINGKVLKIGDQVGGATLSQVTPNEAVLNYRGEKIVLPASAAA